MKKGRWHHPAQISPPGPARLMDQWTHFDCGGQTPGGSDAGPLEPGAAQWQNDIRVDLCGSTISVHRLAFWSAPFVLLGSITESHVLPMLLISLSSKIHRHRVEELWVYSHVHPRNSASCILHQCPSLRIRPQASQSVLWMTWSLRCPTCHSTIILMCRLM